MGFGNYKFECVERRSHLGRDPESFIKLHGVDQRIKEVSATAFHPYKTNFLWSFLYSIYEFFWETKVIKVHVNNQEQPLYVVIEDVAEAMGLDKAQFSEMLNGSIGSGHDLVMGLQLVNYYGFPKERFKDTSALLLHVNILLLLELLEVVGDALKAETITALITLGNKLRRGRVFFKHDGEHFTYCLDRGLIEFKFEDSKRIDLYEIVYKGKKALRKEAAIVPAEIRPTIVSPSQTMTSTKVLHKVNDYIFKSGSVPISQPLVELFASIQMDAKHLNSIVKVINPNHIIQLAQGTYKDQQRKFLNTIVKINACMKKHAGVWNTIFGSALKYKVSSLSHFAFAVNGETAIIIGDKFAEGAFKKASTALVLNTLQKVAELKIDGRMENGAIQLTIEEKRLLEKIAKKNPYLVPPYECVIKDNKRKSLIMFQPYFEGNGTDLGKASPWQLCMAIRDSARGLAQMHQDGYVHSDYKPANLFFRGTLEKDLPIEAKVADIGMAQSTHRPFRGGTIAYLPLEVIHLRDQKIVFRENAKADPKIDSFSLGVSLYEILGGRLPDTPLAFMSADRLKGQIDGIQRQIERGVKFFPYERKLMLTLVKLTRGLLTADKEQRLSCACVAHKLHFLGGD